MKSRVKYEIYGGPAGLIAVLESPKPLTLRSATAKLNAPAGTLAALVPGALASDGRPLNAVRIATAIEVMP